MVTAVILFLKKTGFIDVVVTDSVIKPTSTENRTESVNREQEQETGNKKQKMIYVQFYSNMCTDWSNFCVKESHKC
ncbi:MAG: hypothetical protein COA66_07845 [Arcobacter sp.]|nr:MAG: hypothetical protein COA66_07845 [Arcobacter sp.]